MSGTATPQRMQRRENTSLSKSTSRPDTLQRYTDTSEGGSRRMQSQVLASLTCARVWRRERVVSSRNTGLTEELLSLPVAQRTTVLPITLQTLATTLQLRRETSLVLILVSRSMEESLTLPSQCVGTTNSSLCWMRSEMPQTLESARQALTCASVTLASPSRRSWRATRWRSTEKPIRSNQSETLMVTQSISTRFTLVNQFQL
mmetsp:Transcript_2567/g.9801  ORF Transcript_2567/g.9801 Transcript_2567/m.9801 type:complete len:203 (+) Transcript_2567:398-1006(+)